MEHAKFPGTECFILVRDLIYSSHAPTLLHLRRQLLLVCSHHMQQIQPFLDHWRQISHT